MDRQGLHEVRMMPCLGRLQHQTSWTGGILTGKMAFERIKRLAKVVPTLQLGALKVSPPVRTVRITPVLQLQTSWTGAS